MCAFDVVATAACFKNLSLEKIKQENFGKGAHSERKNFAMVENS